jgi:hypothetical protein
MPAATSTAERRCAPWPKDALRISFGVIWLIDAVLKWLPGFKTATWTRSWAPGTATIPPGAIPQPAPPADDLPAGHSLTL